MPVPKSKLAGMWSYTRRLSAEARSNRRFFFSSRRRHTRSLRDWSSDVCSSDLIVWDKAASIRFRKPGKGSVKAEFRLSDEQLDEIRSTLTMQEKYEPTFMVQVKDEAGEVVAEVQKVLHIRRRKGTSQTAG